MTASQSVCAQRIAQTCFFIIRERTIIMNHHTKQYTREDIINLVRDEDVEFIRLQFTDMLGCFKNIAVTASQLEKALDNRCSFDASALEAMGKDGETELYLHPDYDTFEIFPWRPQQGKVARLICDVCDAQGQPFAADPRYILKRALREAADMGYCFEVGPECEFFLFHCDETGLPTTLTHEQAGYFDMSPLDQGENARRDMVMTLEEMGFEVEASHHESAPAQHEIDFRRDEALKTADNIMTFKLAVKTLARRHGLHATFMPKPKYGADGSGMHLTMALLRDGKNIFTDTGPAGGLCEEAQYFIGGILRHACGMSAVTNPLVNSYKRLVSGYEAPVYIAWSDGCSKSRMIRVVRDQEAGVRIELRSPDSAANPYLALALCLQAGLDGIKHKILPPVCADCAPSDRAEGCGDAVRELPDTLIEALQEMKGDPLIRAALGEYAYAKYSGLKKKEWDRYKAQVSAWELEQYLSRY